MSLVEASRPRPLLLDEDHALLDAFLDAVHHQPMRPVHALDGVLAKAASMVTAQTREAQTQISATAARSQAVAAEWEFHHAIQNMKDHLCAELGLDPNQLLAQAHQRRARYQMSIE